MSPSWLKSLLFITSIARSVIGDTHVVSTGAPCDNPGTDVPSVCDSNKTGYEVRGVYFAAYCDQAPIDSPLTTDYGVASPEDCLLNCLNSADCFNAVWIPQTDGTGTCEYYGPVGVTEDVAGQTFFMSDGACPTRTTTTSSSTTTTSSTTFSSTTTTTITSSDTTTTTSSTTTSTSFTMTTTSEATTSSTTISGTTTPALPACTNYPSDPSVTSVYCSNTGGNTFAKGGHIWTVYCGQAAVADTIENPNDYVTFTDCLNDCAADLECTAAQFDYESSICVWYTGSVTFFDLGYAALATTEQWIAAINADCDQPTATTSSTTATSSSTTESTSTITTTSETTTTSESTTTTPSDSTTTTSESSTTTTSSTESNTTTTVYVITSSTTSDGPTSISTTTSTSSTTPGMPSCPTSDPVPTSCNVGTLAFYYDGEEYTVGSKVFQLFCNQVISGNPIGPDQFAESLTECVQICADNDDCYGASYTADDNNCQLLPASGSTIVYSGSGEADAAILVSPCQPASPAATTISSTTTSTRSTTTLSTTSESSTTTNSESTTTTSEVTTTTSESTTTTSESATTTSEATTTTPEATTTSSTSTTTTGSTSSTSVSDTLSTSPGTTASTSSLTTSISSTTSIVTSSTGSTTFTQSGLTTTSTRSSITTTLVIGSTTSTLTGSSTILGVSTSISASTGSVTASTSSSTTSSGSVTTSSSSGLTTTSTSRGTVMTSTLTTTTNPGGISTPSTSSRTSTASGVTTSSISTISVVGTTSTTSSGVSTSTSTTASELVPPFQNATIPIFTSSSGKPATSTYDQIVTSSTKSAQWVEWESWTSTASGMPYGATITDPASHKDGSWGKWQSPDPPVLVTITLTTTYVVPCSTGWTTSTMILTTTHCGCIETLVPTVVPMTTYTTTCPPEWGLGTSAIVLTVPAPTASPTSISSKSDDQTGYTKISGSTMKTSSTISTSSWTSSRVTAPASASSAFAWDLWNNSTESSATWVSSTKVTAAATVKGSSTGLASATIKPWKGAASTSFGTASKVALIMVGGIMVLFL